VRMSLRLHNEQLLLTAQARVVSSSTQWMVAHRPTGTRLASTVALPDINFEVQH